jgi:hypothetical protein
MEDFGYKKPQNTDKNKNLFNKKFLTIFATFLSIAIFIYISKKAYYFFNNHNSKNIETIKGPDFAIKITENNDYQNTENDAFNSTIYENILNRHKNNLEKENIKINKHQEPAYPPINNKEIIQSDDIINNLEKNIKKNNNSKSEINEIIVKNNESYSQKSAQSDSKKIINNLAKEDLSANKENLTPNKLSPKNINKDEKIANLKNIIDSKDTNKAPNNNLEKKYKSIRVQISAMSSKENCKDYFQKLSNQYSKLFSKRKSYVEEANLGKRGIFYRLQIGDFFNQIEAEEFCAQFISQTQKNRSECIIVE